MKTLILIRHAKASPLSPTASEDKYRSLAPKGEMQCASLARKLEQSFPHTKIACVSSDATRASETASLINRAAPDTLVHLDDAAPELYNAGPETLFEWICLQGDKAASETGTLAITAHNPGLTELAWRLLSRANIAPEPNPPSFPMPTGSAVSFDFPVDRWSDIDGATPVYRGFLLP